MLDHFFNQLTHPTIGILQTGYFPLILGVSLCGILITFFKDGQDEDILAIQRMLEIESERPVPDKNLIEFIDSSRKTHFYLVLTTLSEIILLLICYLLSRRYTSQVGKKISILQKYIKAELERVENTSNSTILEMRIKNSKDLEDYTRNYQGILSNERQRITQILGTTKNRVENMLKQNFKRIEKVRKGFVDLIVTDDEVKRAIDCVKKLEQRISSAESKVTDQYTHINEQANKLRTTVSKLEDSSETATVELYKKMNLMKVMCYRSNIQLESSKILFNTALLKYENVERTIKRIINDEPPTAVSESTSNTDIELQKRLERCIQMSLETREKLRFIECKKSNDVSNSHVLSEVLEDHLLEKSDSEKGEEESGEFEYFKIYSDGTDLTIADLDSRLKKLEASHQLSQKNLNKIQSDSNKQSTDEMDSWVNDWISAIYGLLNSDVIQLQSQILGNEKFKGLELLEETSRQLGTRYKIMSTFVSECREICLKLMNNISVIAVESHMVQNNDEISILGECQNKIQITLQDLFEKFMVLVKQASLGKKEEQSLIQIMAHFHERLCSDLTAAASDYLLLFKRNVNDFYLIQQSLSALSSSYSEQDSSESDRSYDKSSTMTTDSFLSTSSWKDDKMEYCKPLKLTGKNESGL